MLFNKEYSVISSCQKPTSTRTRIKTCYLIKNIQLFRHVRNQLPLEQGLRLATKTRCYLWGKFRQKPTSTRTRIKTLESILYFCVEHFSCQKPTSTRTRIKTYTAINLLLCKKVWVRNQLPLEQGLRPCFATSIRIS